MIERKGENLIWPQSRVIAVFAVNNIVKVSAFLVPETLIERRASLLGMFGQFRRS